MISFQVTIGAAATPLIAANSPNKYASWLVVQNNAGANFRMGGSTITSAIGIAIASGTPGGSVTGQFNFPRGALLNSIYVAGTPGTIVDVAYEPSE